MAAVALGAIVVSITIAQFLTEIRASLMQNNIPTDEYLVFGGLTTLAYVGAFSIWPMFVLNELVPAGDAVTLTVQAGVLLAGYLSLRYSLSPQVPTNNQISTTSPHPSTSPNPIQVTHNI